MPESNNPTLAGREAPTVEGRLHQRAMDYARTLAVSLHKQHYAQDAPMWRPCDDLLGLLTQIDNMACGLALRAEGRGYRRPGAADGVAVMDTSALVKLAGDLGMDLS